MFNGVEIIGGPLKWADGGNGGMIESNRRNEQNDGVKEELLKVTERDGVRHYMGQIQPWQRIPPKQSLVPCQRTIYTKTNEITDPRVTYVSMYVLPLG